MATKKTNNARLVPFILMSLLTLIFLIWAMQQCSRDDGDFAMIAEREARETYIDTMRRAEQDRQLQTQMNVELEARTEAMRRALTQPLPGDSVVRVPAASVVIQKVTPLYSTINGLNVRTGPNIKNNKVARLNLYEEVAFAGEVTDSLYTIDLGEVSPTAPWVKVKLKDGKEGWVFGAGVSYYKFELKGVLTD